MLTWQPTDEFEIVGNGWTRAERAPVRRPRAIGPAVVVGEAVITTGHRTDSARLQSTVAARSDEIAECLRRVIQPGTVLKSVSQWRFTVSAAGKVTGLQTPDFGLGDDFRSCVQSIARSLSFPRGPAGTFMVPVMFDSQALDGPKPRPVDPSGGNSAEIPWTPFAVLGGNPTGSEGIARATEAAVRGRQGAIEQCFADAKPHSRTGSARTLLELSSAGEVFSVRAGGLGERAVEQCLEEALGNMEVISPLARAAEIACDISRGDAEPWLVSPDGGYEVVTIDSKQVRSQDLTLVVDGTAPDPLPPATAALLVVDPAAKGGLITLAIEWVANIENAMIALAGDGPSPRYLAMARTSAIEPGLLRDGDVVIPMLRVSAQKLTACRGGTARSVALHDQVATSALVAKLANACKSPHCASTLVVALDPDAVAQDLVEVMGTARLHGFDRVLIGAELDCRTPR